MNGNVWSCVLEWLFRGIGAAAGVIAYLALSCLLRVKEKWWCRAFCLGGCWLSVIMIIYIGDMINFAAAAGIFMVMIWVACEGSGMKRLTLGLMFISTILGFNGLYDNSIGYICYLADMDFLYSWMYLPVRFFFAAFLYLLLRARRIERGFELSMALWRMLLMLTLSPFGIMLSLIMLRSPFYERSQTVLADGLLFLVVELSFLVLLGIISVLEGQQRLERENLLAMQNRQYYEAMEQQQFEIRRLRHDMSNHLQALLALTGQQKDDYIRGMLDNPILGKVLVWCRDATVNAVLTVKAELMRQKDIRFYAKVDIGEELPFDRADICAVFANALDNAVEGCAGLPVFRREIQLDARTGKGILALRIQNDCGDTGAEALETGDAGGISGQISAASGGRMGKGRLPHTTKKDEKNHGYGLRSIRTTVEKYGGNMEVYREEGHFCLFLYLPLERQ